MAKIIRKVAKIFGSSAGGTQIGVFGSFAAGSPAYSSDPEIIQSLANWLGGWYSAILGANSPASQDVNAVDYVLSYQAAYLMQTGVPEWDMNTTYYIGSIVNDGNGVLYVSVVNDNLDNSLLDTDFWALFLLNTNTQTVTSNNAISSSSGLIRSNSTAGALTHTLPSVTIVPTGKTVIIKDVGTGGFTTTVKGNGAELIDGTNVYPTTLSALNSMTVRSNGTSWDVV